MSAKSLPKAAISGSSTVLLVSDVKASAAFYQNLGFAYEEIGGPDVSHVHVSRGNLTLILHPAASKSDVRPYSSMTGGLYFDVYAYTDAVDLLVDEIRVKELDIVNGPHFSENWNEVTIKDIDGYRITFGGGLSTDEVSD
ncbi:VOC family protein [Paenibacillus montanisoli]|uniref:Bleomycin resistance protein n=1 Tax=Paenibacillus montanisoli TaxID=2081970 RepID=A0A328U7N9_9BACL|nr:VOC family protein [Paenibacillus montanisoli]RAP77411.1 bleomycin resistance protein [Paenibacillus montanisoli]